MYRVTQVLSVGRFATPERAAELLAGGVTHVLNVSDSPSVVTPAAGFREVAWVPLTDSARWPPDDTVAAIDALHRLAAVPGSHVYVHCLAGQLRSPTVMWLYLIALGVPPKEAQDWIEERSPDAIPGPRRLINHEHVLLAQTHGLANYFPHPPARDRRAV